MGGISVEGGRKSVLPLFGRPTPPHPGLPPRKRGLQPPMACFLSLQSPYQLQYPTFLLVSFFPLQYLCHSSRNLPSPTTSYQKPLACSFPLQFQCQPAPNHLILPLGMGFAPPDLALHLPPCTTRHPWHEFIRCKIPAIPALSYLPLPSRLGMLLSHTTTVPGRQDPYPGGEGRLPHPGGPIPQPYPQ